MVMEFTRQGEKWGNGVVWLPFWESSLDFGKSQNHCHCQSSEWSVAPTLSEKLIRVRIISATCDINIHVRLVRPWSDNSWVESAQAPTNSLCINLCVLLRYSIVVAYVILAYVIGSHSLFTIYLC